MATRLPCRPLAARFLFDHARSDDDWPYEQLEGTDYGLLTPLIAEAAEVYGQPLDPAAIHHRFNHPERESERLHHLTRCHKTYF